MPIYEFTCGKCNKDFEKICRSTSNEEIKCPDCSSNDVSKKFSMFAVSSGGRSKGDFDTSSFSAGGSHKSGCGSCSTRSCSTCH